jgi:hypothetical protein
MISTRFAPAALVLAMAGDSVRRFGGGVNHLFVGRPSSASGFALNHQWQTSSSSSGPFTNPTDGGNLSGATSSTLNITNLTLANAAYYQVVVTNTAGSTTSRVAQLVVNSSTPLYTWSPPVPVTTRAATLTQSGSVVGAAVFAGTEQLVVLANGTNINFKADGSVAPVTGSGTATGAVSSSPSSRNTQRVG